MGIFNLGGIASSYSTGFQKQSTWDKIGKVVSDFEKTYNQYPPQNTIDKTSPINYTASPVKKSINPMLLIGGGIAVILAIILFK